MNVIKLSSINWLNAMNELSIGAFYLLNVLYRKDIDVNDENLMSETGYGVSTHRKHKRELLSQDYLLIVQEGKASYQYTVKEPHGH